MRESRASGNGPVLKRFSGVMSGRCVDVEHKWVEVEGSACTRWKKSDVRGLVQETPGGVA